MRDYSDAPAWATEAFFTKPYEKSTVWYYGNEEQYVHKQHVKERSLIHKHTDESRKIISGKEWWREPINCIVENE